MNKEKIKRFISKCKILLNNLNSEKIESVRKEITKVIEESLK